MNVEPTDYIQSDFSVWNGRKKNQEETEKKIYLWGQRICDPGPLYIRTQDPHRGETLLRTCNESPGILKLRRKERHAIKDSPQSAPRRKDEYSIGAVQGKVVTFTLNAPTNVLAALMGKRPLNSVATKNKGKAVITAIKYSAPDRAMLFNFYNHPQPLWVWADKTSSSPIKLNLHINVRERKKVSIKGGGSSPKERGTDRLQDH